MDILKKVNQYNKYISGFYIYAIVYPEKVGGNAVALYYKYPMEVPTCFISFETVDEFLDSNPIEVLKENGFVSTADKM